MKKIAAFIAEKFFLGFLGFYLCVGFLLVSILLGLLMKFGVLATPLVFIAIGQFTWHTALFAWERIVYLATHPLDLIFTLLAATLLGYLAYQAFIDSKHSANRQKASKSEFTPAIRGTRVQSLSTVQDQLARRRQKAQQQVNEYYAKLNIGS